MVCFHNVGFDNGFLDMTQKSQAKKNKVDKIELHKS